MRAFLVFLTVAALTHAVTLFNFPGIVMNQAFKRMEARGLPLHKFVLTDRATPENQPVVRPSPDLAYSICRFDVSDGPVRIKGASWDGYASLSVFDSQTNNVFATSLDNASSEPRSVIVALESDLPEGSSLATPVIQVKDGRGLALIRRLAPSDELFAETRRISAGDSCAPIGLPS